MEQPKKPAGYASFADDLKRMPTHELLEMADGVRQLLDSPGWASVQGIIGRKREVVVDALVHTPKVLEQAEYARQTGIATALDMQYRAAAAIVYAADVREAREQAAADKRQAQSESEED